MVNFCAKRLDVEHLHSKMVEEAIGACTKSFSPFLFEYNRKFDVFFLSSCSLLSCFRKVYHELLPQCHSVLRFQYRKTTPTSFTSAAETQSSLIYSCTIPNIAEQFFFFPLQDWMSVKQHAKLMRSAHRNGRRKSSDPPFLAGILRLSRVVRKWPHIIKTSVNARSTPQRQRIHQNTRNEITRSP